ncbi:MAG: hypothetical protein K0Q55_3810, partial [Verrucomicrobia bacterium]|nr:hypothetical protein [Verrucomicrobiota bacterium]
MDQVQPPRLPITKEQRNTRRLLTGLGVLVVLATGWAIYLAYLGGIENRLRTECLQRNEPLTMTEMPRLYPPVKDEENAAVPLLELWTEESPFFPLRFKQPVEENFPVSTEIPAELGTASGWLIREETTEADWKALADHLLNLKSRRDKLLTALRRPSCRFPLDFNQGFHMQLPHVKMLRLEADNLCLDAVLAVHSNRVDRAIEDVCAMSDLARLLSQEPLLISQIVSAGLYRQALETGAYLLSRKALSADQLARLRTACSWYASAPLFQKALLCERAAILSIYSMSPKDLRKMVDPEGDPDSSGYVVLIAFAKVSGGKRADSIHILNSFRAAETLTKAYAPGDHATLKDIFTRKPP